MTAKKKLITRMAKWTVLVLLVGALVGSMALFIESVGRDDWESLEKRRRAELFEESRIYVGELANTIDSVPIDPTLVNEIESRYFSEYDNGPIAVWAMATDGTFLFFGVPRESFSRMNAIYDREITPRLNEGVFFDRQSFFLGQLDDDGETLLLSDLSGDPLTDDDEEVDLFERLSRYADRSEDSFVLSAPLKTSDGVALGSLYLSRSMPERRYYRANERVQVVAGAGGAVTGAAFFFLWILLPTWVYVDARERGVRRAPLFAFLTAISSLIGLVVYLIARPEEGRSLLCPGCDHEVNGGAYCPHCGRDLSASFCQTCRYPLAPEWSYCPSCRTEIEPPSPEIGVEPPAQDDPLPETG